MTWYDYDYNEGHSATHRHTDAEWWQAAWDSGIVVDRSEMKQLRNDAVGIREIEEGEWIMDNEIVNSKSSNSKVFDLQGRRLSKPTKGLYIQGNKVKLER